MTARSDRDLTPDSILQKISDASGSKYSSTPATFPAPTPSLSTKPVFTPTHGSTGGGGGFNPLASRSRFDDSKASNVDGDGWGADAPPVSRTSLEKVQSSYQPTKIDLRGPAAGGRGSEQDQSVTAGRVSSNADVVKGGYQPVGKVDISQIRAQSQHNSADDRSAPVKGAYEPVGKVDIAAIRARAQKSTTDHSTPSSEPASQSEVGGSVSHQSASLRGSERLTSLPKPKVANQFGTNVASFSGTKAPTPSSLGSDRKPTTTPVGVGRTFADQGGKTPAQIWAEKKTRERGLSATNDSLAGPSSSQKASASVGESSGGTEWKSGYTGKSWASVQTTRTGQSSASTGEQHQEENQDVAEDTSPAESSGIEAIRSKFKDMPPIGAADAGESGTRTLPPVLDMSNKPNAGQARPETSSPAQPAINEDLREQGDRMPSPPSRQPRSPTPPTPPAVTGSPIRVAMPVGRGSDGPKVTSAHDDLVSGSTMPTDSLSKALPREDDIPSDIGQTQDTARRAAEAVATETDQDTAPLSQEDGGLKALVQFDYEKAEDNEIELTEGEYVTNIEMVDDNWWMGQNARGESGLFPSNYVELTEEGKGNSQREDTTPAAEQPNGPTATALYDYEAAEENELSFPEGAVIRDIVSRCCWQWFCTIHMLIWNRNSQMRTGGLGSMNKGRACFQLIMLNSTTNIQTLIAR